MKKLICMLSCILFLVACNSQTIIEWVDFVKVNGDHYERVYSGIITDSAFIGEEIGKVKYKVADHVSDVDYKTKDGDAAYWEKGTKVFAVKGESQFAAIKTKDAINGYAIYHEVSSNPSFQGKYTDIDIDSVTQIEIYKENKDNQPLLIHTLSNKQEIQALNLILNEGKSNSSFTPNMTQGDPTSYQLAFYRDEPIAYQFPLFFDGEQWYWVPWDTDLLSDEIERFITEQ